MQLILMVLLSLASTLWAGTEPLTYKIHHRKTNLALSWDGKFLKAQDRLLNLSLTVKECNKKLLDDFFALDAKIWKDVPAQMPDPIEIEKNGKMNTVAAQSSLGSHLLSLSHKLKFLAAESQRLCK